MKISATRWHDSLTLRGWVWSGFVFFLPLYVRGMCNICVSNMVSTHFSHAIPSISHDHKSVNEANYLTIPLEIIYSMEIRFSGKLN